MAWYQGTVCSPMTQVPTPLRPRYAMFGTDAVLVWYQVCPKNRKFRCGDWSCAANRNQCPGTPSTYSPTNLPTAPTRCPRP
eukprot:3293986-Rhodomonas_salina.2